MPISVDQYENLAGQVLSIYEEAEQKMVERVSRRLERGITQPGWTEKKYAEMYLMRNELAKINEQMIYDRRSITDDLVKTAYLKASQSFVNEARTYAEALHVDKYSPNVVKVINILTDLNNTMNVADRNILRRANDAYSDIVGRTSALMATGTITTRQAVQIELNRFANQGIGSFVDKAGRVWDMSTYAEMATLTAIERATIAGYTDTMQEYGYDLAQISNHFGACPICEAWEGVIISVTGSTPGYLSLSDAEGAGVFHPRCLHFISTYYEGFSPKGRTQPRAVTAPNIGYSARSKQRAFERAERMWKRRMAAAVSPEEERRAYAHVREYQDRIRELLGKYNAEQPLEVDHLFRKWYREGGRVTLSPEARRLIPYKIPDAWKPQPIDMAKLNAISTPNPPLVSAAPAPELTFKEKIEALKHPGGQYTIEQYKDAGKMVFDEYKNAFNAKYEKEIDELRQIKSEYDVLKDKFSRESKFVKDIADYKERMAKARELYDSDWYLKYHELGDKMFDISKKLNNESHNVLLDKLKELKDFGGYSKDDILKKLVSNATYSNGVKDVHDATKYYPTSWIEHRILAGKLEARRINGRAYFMEFGNNINTNGSLSTSIHEFGHSMEYAMSNLFKASKEFYTYRTQGEKSERLYKIYPGRGYKRDEVVKRDKFIDVYMGKDYSDAMTELLSMGYEKLFTAERHYYDKDEEMRDWLLGLMALED